MKKLTKKHFVKVLENDTELRKVGMSSHEEELGTIQINSYYSIYVTKVEDGDKTHYNLEVINTRNGDSVPVTTYNVKETLDRARFKEKVYEIVEKYDNIYEEESKYAHIIDLYEILDPYTLYNEFEIDSQEDFIEYYLNNKDQMLYNLIYMLREERGF